jgi:hypothetical protein
MLRKRPRLNPTVLVDLAEMRHRLLNDTATNPNAAHQPPPPNSLFYQSPRDRLIPLRKLG